MSAAEWYPFETVSLIADSIGSSRGEVAMCLLPKSKSVETVSLIADSIGSSCGDVSATKE